jgi:4-amino-4-deoxy-L-arabinose transferase-like glycosyltransferase
MNRRVSILILLALSLSIYVGTAGWPALLDDADSAHAVAAREMLQTGDWAVLHINGIRYLEKPPLHYWLVAGSYALLGESAFSTRLPLALAVVGLVLMVYAFGRHFFGDRAGLYAGLAMCTSAGVFLFTRIMIPEAIYALEFTAAFYLFLRAWTGTLEPRWGYWGTAALLGLAMLTRSLPGVVFPVAILTLFVLLTGETRRWREFHVVSSTVIFLAIALPWHLIAALRTPRFFWFYFLNEQVFRALGWRYPADYEAVPLLLWLAAHLVWFFPWSLFLPYAVRECPPPRTWRKGLDAACQARLFLFIWTGFILLFFSWTKSRMEYYSFGAWPAIALLLGLGLARAEQEHRRWLPRLQAGLAVLGTGIALSLGWALWVTRSVTPTGDITRLLEMQDPEFYRLAMSNLFDLTLKAFADLRVPAAGAGACLLAGLCLAWFFRRGGRALASNLTLALAMAGFLIFANSAYGVFEPHLSSRPVAKAILRYLGPSDEIAIYGEFEGASSVGFYTGRRILLYNGRYNGLEWGSYYHDAPKIFLNDRTFPALWDSPARVFLIVPPQQRRAALVRLPKNSTYFVTEIGGKAVYVNHPIAPDQRTLAQIEAEANPPKPRLPSGTHPVSLLFSPSRLIA